MPERHIAKGPYVYRAPEAECDGVMLDCPAPLLKVLAPPQSARELARRIAEALNDGRV